MRLISILSALPGLTLAMAAQANDGFGGLTATGLSFGKTEAIAMVEEELFISRDRIAVEYLFRNLTSQDVTAEVIFPLPPVLVWSGWYSDMNLPEDLSNADLVNFTAKVDGLPVAVSIDRIAVIEDPWDEERPLSAAYDTPGRDVTADLMRFGIPLTLDVVQAAAALMALPEPQRQEIAAAGLAEFLPGDPAQNLPPEALGQWSIVTRYHWTQTFPAGKDIRIAHAYDNRPPGGLFSWEHPPQGYDSYVEQYCIDDGTSQAIARTLGKDANGFGQMGTAYAISYVLRTARTWAGPIGRFRLTLDKGEERNVISLCASDVRKTGPTTFVIEKTDFIPERDLEILLVEPWSE